MKFNTNEIVLLKESVLLKFKEYVSTLREPLLSSEFEKLEESIALLKKLEAGGSDVRG